jgi:hypothetical protein
MMRRYKEAARKFQTVWRERARSNDATAGVPRYTASGKSQASRPRTSHATLAITPPNEKAWIFSSVTNIAWPLPLSPPEFGGKLRKINDLRGFLFPANKSTINHHPTTATSLSCNGSLVALPSPKLLPRRKRRSRPPVPHRARCGRSTLGSEEFD